jgi:hypothetical protein
LEWEAAEWFEEVPGGGGDEIPEGAAAEVDVAADEVQEEEDGEQVFQGQDEAEADEYALEEEDAVVPAGSQDSGFGEQGLARHPKEDYEAEEGEVGEPAWPPGDFPQLKAQEPHDGVGVGDGAVEDGEDKGPKVNEEEELEEAQRALLDTGGKTPERAG